MQFPGIPTDVYARAHGGGGLTTAIEEVAGAKSVVAYLTFL